MANATAAKKKPTTAKAVPTTPGSGKSVQELVRAANKWRDFYYVLRGMTQQRVIDLIDRAQHGDYAELQLLLEKSERRYPVCKALKSRRQSALGKLAKDWDVKILETLPPGATQQMAEKQQAHLKGRYNLIKNLRQTIRFLMLAEFRGYSILQKRHYKRGPNDGAVSEFYWLPQDQFARDGKYGDWYWNEKSQFGANAQTLGEKNRIGSDDLPREDFLIREVDTPLFEIILFAFLNWLMGRKDWSAFVEIFGLPNGVAIMPPNIPNGEQDKYRIAAEKVAEGVSGALPNGSDMKFPTAGVRNNGPFKEFCDASDEDVVFAGTGGKLTMMTGPEGLGGGQSKVHQDSFNEIAVEDGEDISEVFQRDFDAVELGEAFPGQPVCVYFVIAPSDEEDADKIADTVVKLEGVGLQTDAAEISERTGFKLTRVEKPNMPASEDDISKETTDAIKNRLLKILNSVGADDVKSFAAAVGNDVAPVLSRLQAISEIKDDEIFERKLKAFYAEYSQLKSDILKDPSADRALLPIIIHALLVGLKKEPVKNRAGKILNGDYPGHEFHGNQYVELPDEHWSGTPKEMRQRAKEIMKGFKTATHPKLGGINFTARGRGKTLSDKKTPHEFQSVQALPQLIEKGKLISSEPDREGRASITAVHRIEHGLKIGDSKYRAGIVIRSHLTGAKTANNFYLHQIDHEK